MHNRKEKNITIVNILNTGKPNGDEYLKLVELHT